MTDQIIWNIIGNKQIRGKNEFTDAMNQMKNHNIEELRIHNIITHGNAGAVNGTIKQSRNRMIAFCDIFHFDGFGKNAKIKAITSYVIETS